MYVLAQILGVLAIICWVISIQNNNKKNILICQLLANFLYFIQYFLLNAFTASFMNLVSTIRCFVFYDDELKKNKTSKYSLVFFILIIILIGIFTFDRILSLIPILITLAYTYTSFQDNLSLTRYIFIIAAFIWIYYNFQVGAYVSICGNVLEIISGVISIIRFRR